MVSAIRTLGGEPLICPMIEVRALPIVEEYQKLLSNLPQFEWLIFTSASAAETFYEWLKKTGNASQPASLRIVTVGKKTADAVRRLGWHVDAIAEEASAESVVATLFQHGIECNGAILFPRALEGRDVIPRELEKIGVKIFVLPVYQTVPTTPNNLDALRARLRERTIDAITFTSPSAVNQCLRLLPVKEWPILREICLAAIGHTTAAAIIEHGLNVSVMPKTASAVDMIEAIANYLSVEKAPLVGAS
jgi:uroporphyrinogen-III synthase